MKPMHALLAATLVAVPLIVAAQTANTPGGQASTGTGLDQTKNAPQQTTPTTTKTTPDVTNPSGALPSKETIPAHTRAGRRALRRDGARTEPDNVPTGPLPARDVTPTQ